MNQLELTQCGFTSHLTCARSSCTRRTPLRIMHAQIGGLYRRYSAPVRIRVKWAYRRYASHGRTCGHILKGVYEVNHLTYLHVNLAQVCSQLAGHVHDATWKTKYGLRPAYGWARSANHVMLAVLDRFIARRADICWTIVRTKCEVVFVPEKEKKYRPKA